MLNSEVIRGPAVIKKGSDIVYTEGDVTVTPEITYTEGMNAVQGKYNDFLDSVQIKIAFTPAPQVLAAYFSMLFPYHTPVLGSAIYGDSPDDVVVWSVDGKQYTYKGAALTQMPSLVFAADKPIFEGEAVFTALGTPDETWDTDNHFASVATLAFTDTSFNQALDIRSNWPLAWGASSPWDDIKTEAGVKIDFDLQLANVMSDEGGVIDMTLAGLTATASLTPYGITPEQLLAKFGIQGTGARRGRGVRSLGETLQVNAAGAVGEPVFSLNYASLKQSPTQFGAEINRVGEIQLESLNGLNSQVFSLAVAE